MSMSSQTRLVTGGILLAASLQYFVAEILTALAWTKVPYSFFHNYISDLGVPECIVLPSRAVCSPAHLVMDTSFILQGILIIAAFFVLMPLIKRARTRATLGTLALLFGIGIIIVGSFPGSTAEVIAGNQGRQTMHVLGAFLAICFGNILLIVAGVTIRHLNRAYALLSITMGCIGLVAIFLSQITTLGLGVGGIERIAVNSIIIWFILTGGTLLISPSLRASLGKHLL